MIFIRFHSAKITFFSKYIIDNFVLMAIRFNKEDTIVALATPAGTGAIAISCIRTGTSANVTLFMTACSVAPVKESGEANTAPT